MTDIEIFVDRIADLRIAQMNLVLETTRQEVIRSHAPGENDLYVRTLKLGQVQKNDFSATRFMMIWTALFRIFVSPKSPIALPPIHSRLLQRSRKSLTMPCSWAVTRKGSATGMPWDKKGKAEIDYGIICI